MDTTAGGSLFRGAVGSRPCRRAGSLRAWGARLMVVVIPFCSGSQATEPPAHLFFQEISGHYGGLPARIHSIYANAATSLLEVSVEDEPDWLSALGRAKLDEATRLEIARLCAALRGPETEEPPASAGEYQQPRIRFWLEWPPCPPLSWEGPEDRLPPTLQPLLQVLRARRQAITVGRPGRSHYLRARPLPAKAAAEAQRLGLVLRVDERAIDLLASLREPGRLIEPERQENPFSPLFESFRPGRTVAELALGKNVFQVRSLATQSKPAEAEIH